MKIVFESQIFACDQHASIHATVPHIHPHVAALHQTKGVILDLEDPSTTHFMATNVTHLCHGYHSFSTIHAVVTTGLILVSALSSPIM